MRTRKMLRAFLKTCRAVQLLHTCVIKFKVSGTVARAFANLRVVLHVNGRFAVLLVGFATHYRES